MTAEKILFFISFAVGGIGRHAKRYAFLGSVVFFTTLALTVSLLISVAAGGYLAANGVGGGYNSVRASIDGIYAFCNIMALCFAFLGILGLIFSSALLCNDRLKETGILYSIGMSRSYIFAVMLAEALLFIAALIIAALLASVIIVLIAVRTALPSALYEYVSLNAQTFLLLLATAVTVALIPSTILTVKTARYSPLDLLR